MSSPILKFIAIVAFAKVRKKKDLIELVSRATQRLNISPGFSMQRELSDSAGYLLICPFPETMNLVDVSSSRPIGPLA
jgi:hypothetical protein